MGFLDISYVHEGMWLCEKRTGTFVPAMSDRIRFGTKLYRVIHRELTLSDDPWLSSNDHMEVHLEEIKL
jgi:hypothetical protein